MGKLPDPPELVAARTLGGRGPQVTAIPVRPTAFPALNKASALGGVLGTTPFTPQAILRDTAASYQVGRFILYRRANLFGSIAQQWYKLHVDRPTIIYSLNVNESGILSPFGPVIYYNYGKIPSTTAEAQVSERTGICFLSNAGDWYLQAPQPDLEGSFSDVDCLQIDASHPEVAARFLRQPGVNLINEFNVPVASDTVPVVIPTGGRFTRAVTIQNVPDENGDNDPIRYVVSNSPTPYIENGFVGFRLLANGAATFSGDTLTRGVILAMLETPGGSAIEVAQYRDL